MPLSGHGRGHGQQLPHNWRLRRHTIQHNVPALVQYRAKSPALAAIMSAVLPGLGQWYNGHFFKGIFVFLFSWMIIPYFIGIGDAYFSARRQAEFHDRMLLQNLLTTVTTKEYEPFSAVSQVPPAPPADRNLNEFHEYEVQQHRAEKRMVTGGAIGGFGAALEVIAVTVGGGAALSVFGLFPLAIGGTMLFWGWKKQKEWRQKREREEEKKLEKIVVTIAQSKGGTVTVADLVAKTDLGMQEAEKILNTLVTKGYADIRVSEEGVISYHF